MAQDFPVPKLFVEKFRVLLYNSHIYLPREIIQRRSTSEFFERSYPVVCGLSLVAILCAGSIGLLLGIWISEHEKAAGPVLGVANVFYTIPSISLLGMLIPFLGIGNTTAVAALTIYGIMPMVRNTYAGIKGVSEEIILAAEAMGSTRMQIMWKIKLPLAMGVIIAGVRNMVVMTISVTAMTFCGSFLIALIALICDFLLGILEKRMKKGNSI